MLRVFQHEPFLVAGRPVGPFAMNQYLIACTTTREAAIVDSGGDPDLFLTFCEERDLTVRHLLQTHAHVDHVGGLAATKEATGAPVYLHPADAPVYASAQQHGLMFGMRIPDLPPVDVDLVEGATYSVGEIAFTAWHTPGHCPGHVCFVSETHGVVFGGDLLFEGSVGRTDLPGAEPDKMGPSLSRLFTLGDETVVYPGHMRPTTIGAERRSNPFLDHFGVTR